METRKAIVGSKIGLHARPASMFSKEAKTFESTIRVKYGKKI